MCIFASMRIDFPPFVPESFFSPHSTLSQKGALENTLAETESRYSAMLAAFQGTINMLEAEIANVRASIEQQGQDYKMLLDIKTRLEAEIATYRGLLETEESRYRA